MTLQSMTGFARVDGSNADYSWVWELRSVNGKGLDVRFRVPSGCEALEVSCRTVLAKHFSRGNIQASLQLNRNKESAGGISVNETVLEAVIEAAKAIQSKVGGELPDVADLMNVKGVLEVSEVEADDASLAARNQELLASFKAACDQLSQMRNSEGAAIVSALSEQINQVDQLTTQIIENDARKPEAIRENLEAQISRITQANDELDKERLHQEAVIVAAKADLQEELDRLQAHVIAAREHLSGEGPIGRKLEFLAQEFNRECNTICSKSNAVEVTGLGLEMKLAIDQFREQLQNLE